MQFLLGISSLRQNRTYLCTNTIYMKNLTLQVFRTKFVSYHEYANVFIYLL
jgi:hypothetical protein